MGAFRLKYLVMIQSVISRMAANQLTVRKWSVALGTAVIGWAVSKDGIPRHAALALLPAGCFWIMDAYYLSLERGFRALFDVERAIDDDKPSFLLKPDWGLADWFGSLFRPAVWLVHGPVVLLAAAVGRGTWLP